MISSLHRPTLAKVDLSAISENIEQVVSHIPKKVQTFAVVTPSGWLRATYTYFRSRLTRRGSFGYSRKHHSDGSFA